MLQSFLVPTSPVRYSAYARLFFYDVFYDLPSLTHAYDFHMLTVFTCLRLSHVNHIHMLLLYLFRTTTLYYINLLVTSLTAV